MKIIIKIYLKRGDLMKDHLNNLIKVGDCIIYVADHGIWFKHGVVLEINEQLKYERPYIICKMIENTKLLKINNIDQCFVIDYAVAFKNWPELELIVRENFQD